MRVKNGQEEGQNYGGKLQESKKETMGDVGPNREKRERNKIRGGNCDALVDEEVGAYLLAEVIA